MAGAFEVPREASGAPSPPLTSLSAASARFLDEKSCLKLAFAALIRTSRRWRGIRIRYREQLQLMELLGPGVGPEAIA